MKPINVKEIVHGLVETSAAFSFLTGVLILKNRIYLLINLLIYFIFLQSFTLETHVINIFTIIFMIYLAIFYRYLALYFIKKRKNGQQNLNYYRQ